MSSLDVVLDGKAEESLLGRGTAQQGARIARIPVFLYTLLLSLEGLVPCLVVLAILSLSNVTAFGPLLHDLSSALALVARALT